MEIAQVRGWIEAASSIAVLTGAGISAESGIPTFRGPGGLWRSYRPEQLATPSAFQCDPVLVWEWYLWRRQLIAKAAPNAGHSALAFLEQQRAPGTFTLITQNVDGLHSRAGSRNLLELHGSIWITRCSSCHLGRRDDRTSIESLPPRCPGCGAQERPGVVWFGESLPADTWLAAESAVSRCDVFLIAGTSAVVYPAAGLAALAKQSGARIIEVNPEETPVTGICDASFRSPSAQLLPQLW